jgi:hypothetical protein
LQFNKDFMLPNDGMKLIQETFLLNSREQLY